MLSIERLDCYYGAAQALSGVSLAAAPGQITCVLGRNGVGKSTLMRAIVGLQPARSGRIFWDGQDIGRLKAFERARRGIAYVPQGREIFPLLTVRENLETGFATLARRARSVPEDVFELFPVLKTMLRRRGGDLSGGQQQLLAIARALVTRPRLIVLDEPTEGIQPSIIKDIGRAIRTLRGRDAEAEDVAQQIKSAIKTLRERGAMAILLVEQYFEFARDLADSFAVMDRGQIVVAGPRHAMVEADVRRHLAV